MNNNTKFSPLTEAVNILIHGQDRKVLDEIKIRCVLEDVESPITQVYQDKLYQSVIAKKHIDFDDIPKSEGNITRYAGYKNMLETLNVLKSLGIEKKSPSLVQYVDIVLKSIGNIASLSSIFEQGFQKKHEYVMLEYNIYVLSCIEATTTLLYEFVEYMKNPEKQIIDITIRNTVGRANQVYITTLEKFNKVNSTMDYKKYLEAMLKTDVVKESFFGLSDNTAIGAGVVTLIALSIIPLTRRLVYHFYHMRRKISDSLEMHAQFLEVNRNCVEARNNISIEKKKKIIEKQDKQVKFLRVMADKLRVSTAKAIQQSTREIEEDNKKLSLKSIKSEVTNSEISIL